MPFLACMPCTVPGGSSFASAAVLTPRNLGATTSTRRLDPFDAARQMGPNMTKKPKLNQPPQAVSGDEAKHRMARVNGNRALDFTIMMEPGRGWEAQPSRGIAGGYPTDVWRGGVAQQPSGGNVLVGGVTQKPSKPMVDDHDRRRRREQSDGHRR